MVLTLALRPEVEAALQERARREGLSPESMALKILLEKLAPNPALPEPRDEWERRLLAMGKDYGVSLSNEAVSSEGIYD